MKKQKCVAYITHNATWPTTGNFFPWDISSDFKQRHKKSFDKCFHKYSCAVSLSFKAAACFHAPYVCVCLAVQWVHYRVGCLMLYWVEVAYVFQYLHPRSSCRGWRLICVHHSSAALWTEGLLRLPFCNFLTCCLTTSLSSVQSQLFVSESNLLLSFP